jgi:hypothetical protein
LANVNNSKKDKVISHLYIMGTLGGNDTHFRQFSCYKK